MNRKKKILVSLYITAKESKVGDTIKCPSCNTSFVKSSYQQAFCKSKSGTICKDNYWNNVTPDKRNNKTRISPASALFLMTRRSINAPNIVGGSGRISGYTSEGYRVMDGVAYDEFDDPVYNIEGQDMSAHPFDLDY